MVAALEAFKKEHGHCCVPLQPAKYRALATWLINVRHRKRQGLLDRERIRQLDRLGVVWEPNHQKWEKMFADLVAYRDKHGDCNVPLRWSENPRLASWVQRQRTCRTLNTLAKDRIERLDKIGFVWTTRRRSMGVELCGPGRIPAGTRPLPGIYPLEGPCQPGHVGQYDAWI